MTDIKPSLLVVDPGADDSTPFIVDLHAQGYAIRIVRSGEEALQAIAGDQFDLVLLDEDVPARGGFELLHAIRCDYGVLLLPVILILACGDSERAVAALEAGANDYIARPIDRPLLQARIRARLIRIRAARDMERITESLKAGIEKKVAEVEQAAAFLSAVLDNIRDGVVACNATGQLSLLNKAAREMHGLREQALPPEQWAEQYNLFCADGVTRMDTAEVPLFRALRGERVCGQEMKIARNNGREIEIVAYGQTMFDKSGGKLGAVVSMHDVTAQKRAETALRESEERFRSAFETAAHGMALVATDGRWLKVNSALCKIVGYSEEELLQLDFQAITHPDDLDSDLDQVQAVLDGRLSSYQMEKRYFHKNGGTVWILLSVSLVHNTRGEPLYFVSQILDLTERKATEAQLLQAQKMQALGRLTGGVAHDFNNLLSVIMGNAKLLERRLAGNAPATRQAVAISDAARRGADLTQRLLVFSRKGHLEPQIVDCSELLRRLADLLRSIVGETIALETYLANERLLVFVDRNQLESAIVNLATNARDAMPDGGCLTIALDMVRADEIDVETATAMVADEYVVLSVRDTGVGIPTAQRERIFEPFFTTKEVGKGTGLGLSMAFGFAQESGGCVAVDSAVGTGTVVRIYLPRVQGLAAQTDRSHAAGAEREVAAAGGEAILVVEDEPSLRGLVVAWLSDMGYRAVAAEDGPEALLKLEQNPDIELLFTDVVLPGGMTGGELARSARERKPELKVLFTTGYTLSETTQRLGGVSHDPLLAKPYEDTELAKSVRRALDAPAAQAGKACQASGRRGSRPWAV